MTTLFIVSLVVLCGMIASKAFETKVRRIDFLANLFSKGDERIQAVINGSILRYNYYKMVLRIFLFDFIPSYIYEILVKMKDYVSRKYYSAGDEFRGRRILKTNGSVSFFLEQLSDKTSVEKNP